MNYILHTFRPSETIDAVIRLKGRHNYTREEIIVLRQRFNEMNGLIVPRPGQVFKIPLEESILFPTIVDGPVVSDPEGNGQQPTDDQEAGNPDDPREELPSLPESGDRPED